MVDENISKREAIDLWAQMLERAKNHEWSTFDDPSYIHPGHEPDATRQAFKNAGWKDQEIDLMQRATAARSEAAPVTSPGVARFTEAALHRLRKPIETAADKLKIDNRHKVHFAIEPKAGPLLSKINVIMTDQSIITMGSFFTRYCGLVSRAYIRTMRLAPESVGLDFNDKILKFALRKNPDLLIYWWRIFVSFSLTGTHMLTSFKPSNKTEILIMEQVAFSMEVFGLAHEYAHHALDHGRSVSDAENAHKEEFEADAFALKICEAAHSEERFLWIKGKDIQNPYLWTGAGGILLLSSLEAFRKVKDGIFGYKPYDTHPDFCDRSRKIRSAHVMTPSKHKTSLDFCLAVENVLNCVMEELEPLMDGLHSKKIRDLVPDDWEKRSFE